MGGGVNVELGSGSAFETALAGATDLVAVSAAPVGVGAAAVAEVTGVSLDFSRCCWYDCCNSETVRSSRSASGLARLYRRKMRMQMSFRSASTQPNRTYQAGR